MPNRENDAALVRGSLPLSALEICKMSGDATSAVSLGNSNPLATGPYVERLTLTIGRAKDWQVVPAKVGQARPTVKSLVWERGLSR